MFFRSSYRGASGACVEVAFRVNHDPLIFAVRTLAPVYQHRPGWKTEREQQDV